MKLTHASIRFAALLALLGGVRPALADLTVAPGFADSAVDVTSASVFPAGVDRLPNGHAVLFDGTALVEVDVASGAIVGTLFQPATTVFGSFVRVDPTGSYVLFGESSQHRIWRVPLASSAPVIVATLEFNFAAVFLDQDRALITHAQPGWQSTEIVLLDVNTGAMNVIAVVPGASGPLGFDAFGALHYGVNSAVYPAPPGSGAVIHWSSEQVAQAIGGATLTDANAGSTLVGLQAITDIVFDEEGDLIVSDSIGATVVEYDVQSGFQKHLIATEAPGLAYVTALVFAGNGVSSPAHFNPFQPAAGGTLWVMATDFLSYARLQVVTPRRIPLAVEPAAVVPVGPFALHIDAGPPFGQVIVFASAPYTGAGVYVPYLGVPFLFELHAPTLLFVAYVTLDGAGALLIPAVNSGQSPGSASLQAVLLSVTGEPLGTTGALTITLQ